MSRKRHDFDPERTESARFQDSRSYWTMRGQVFLFGFDKMERRMEVLRRDGFRCVCCKRLRDPWNLDAHHIQHLGKGGDDSLVNQETRCKWGPCHRSQHVQVRLRSSKQEAAI